MSDFPPPPAAGPPPPPPPPPPSPNLIAPANYSAYSTGPYGSVPLKRVGGVATAASILVGIAGLMPFADLAMRQTVKDPAEDFLAGRISEREFTDETLSFQLVTGLTGLVQLAAAVLTVIWMFRVAKNHRTLHRGTTWGQGWAIGGWLLPPVVYVIPTLMLGEMWKASDPSVPVGGEWKSRPSSPLPWIWLILYSVPEVIGTVSESADVMDQLGANERVLAEQITGDVGLDIVLAIAMVIAAGVFIALVRQITARHRQLTGEANAR